MAKWQGRGAQHLNPRFNSWCRLQILLQILYASIAMPAMNQPPLRYVSLSAVVGPGKGRCFCTLVGLRLGKSRVRAR